MMQGSLATRLRVLRAERGLPLREAAAVTGVTKETISDLERGLRHPHDPTLAKIAQGYGVPFEELIGEPVPLAEAPEEEAGPSTAEETPPNTPEISEADRDILSALLAQTQLYQDLAVSYGPPLRLLPPAPSYDNMRVIHAWVDTFVNVCNAIDRNFRDNPPFHKQVNSWIERINKDDETLPDEIRKIVLDFEEASEELFDDVVPQAKAWMKAQEKRLPDAELAKLNAGEYPPSPVPEAEYSPEERAKSQHDRS